MAEIIVVWILALIVIAIGWGVVDRIAIPLKVFARSLQTPERAKRFEFVTANLLAVALVSIMVAAADGMGEKASLPAFLMLWTGGLWLIPFLFGAVGHYWISVLAIAAILIVFWIKGTSHPSRRTYARTDVSIRQDRPPTSLTGLGFFLWIVLIGLTVAAIAKYTSTWNAGSLSS